MRRPTASGFTVFEMLIVLLVFVIAAMFAGEILWRSAWVEKKLGAKLDVLRRARMASLRIAQELREGVEIFYPAVGLGRTRPILVFTNSINEQIVLYLNARGELVRQNRHAGDSTEVLARGIARVRFFRKGRRLVNYHVHVQDPQTKEQVHVLSGASLRNNFN